MAEIKVILFDLDDTLLNFKQAEKNAIRTCFSLFGLGVCSDAMLADYSAINLSFWEKLELGEMTKEEILEARFQVFLQKYDFTGVDAAAFNKEYESHLADIAIPMPCAMDVLKGLQGKVRVFVATNGFGATQHKRIEKAGMKAYIERVFVSEEVGAEKPNPAFFQAILDIIPEIRKEEILIVGDSLTSDIKGGCLAGIKTCYFNPKGKENRTEWKPDYEITFLHQIYDLLPHLKTKVALLGFPTFRMQDRGTSYGGNQEWFYPYTKQEDEAKKKMGCGIVALADTFLYLVKKRQEISIPEVEKLLERMESGKGLKTDHYKEYFDFIYQFAGKVTKRRGLSGLQMALACNRICKKYKIPIRANWHIGQENLLQEIEWMLQKDLPVILSIPYVFFGKEDMLPFYREEKRWNGYSIMERNRAKSHYVTVTGIEYLGEKIYLRISSWGRQYVIDYEEYLCFGKNHFLGVITGNILKMNLQ